MFELKCFIDDIVVGEKQKLKHLLVMEEKLVAQIRLGVGLKILPLSHLGIKI
jgi:hypothetical protein